MKDLRLTTLAGLAAITGLFGAVLLLAIAWLAKWPDLWIYALLSWAAISAIAWLLLMRRYLEIVGGDHSGNSPSGISKVYPTTTKVEIVATDPAGEFSAGRWADLKVNLGSLNEVARRLAAGSSFSHAGLAGPGRPLSRSEYEVLRDEFIARGLAYWRSPGSHSQGVCLSRAGVAVMRHFASPNTMLSDLPQLQEVSSRSTLLPKAAHAHTNTRRRLLSD